MKVTTSNAAVHLHQTAVKLPGSEYEFWAGSPAAARECGKATAPHLTPRQLEVLALLCEGLPNKLICRRLNIATGTVKVHISCILRELGVTSRLQAVVAAGSLGLATKLGDGTPDATVDMTAAQPATAARPRRDTASSLSAIAA
jgi:DNA-binding NarL/FixJ family response regulator